MKSNIVTITVSTFDVTGNQITPEKTSVLVNERLNFDGVIEFPSPTLTDTMVEVGIYVNGNLTDTVTVDVPRGVSQYDYSFALIFSEPGTYSVYTDAVVSA